MEDLRKGMYEVARKLERYSDEWEFKLVDGGETTSVRFRRFIDGKRHQFAVIVEDRPVLEDGYDGKNAWVIDHLHRVYAFGPATDKAIVDESVLKPMQGEPGTLRVDMLNAYDIRIAAVPDFKIADTADATLGSVPARKYFAAAKVSDKRQVNVEMWFERDRWQLLKVHLTGKTREGHAIEADMDRTKASTTENYGSEAFGFVKTKVVGYDQHPLSEFGFAMKSDSIGSR